MKKKVIHLMPHLKMGGAEALVKDYAININKSKFEFQVVTISGKTDSFNEKKLNELNIKVIHLGDDIEFNKEDKRIIRIVKKIKRYMLFKKHILIEKPDVIHSHLQTNDFLLFIDTKKMGIKLFHTLHNEVNVLFRRDRWLYTYSTKYCIKKKNMKLIALHERMKEESIAFFKNDNCIVVKNAIDVQRFRRIDKDKVPIKKELGINENAFVVGHIGRFSIQKNHSFLIDIFEKLSNRMTEAILLLIGIGELQEEIKDKITSLGLKDKVLFLGNRKDIPELMSIMDIFLFPSLHEGFPIVLIEAQAAGLKCIVSDVITKEAFLTNQILSLKLDDSSENWSNKILDSQKISKEYSNLKDYDIKTVMKKLEETYVSEVDYK